jgi:hypothetical protein
MDAKAALTARQHRVVRAREGIAEGGLGVPAQGVRRVFDTDSVDLASTGASPAERVAVASARQPLQAGEQARGGRRWGGLGEDALQAALRVGLGLAPGAGGEVRQDTLARIMTELSVHQGGEAVTEVLLDGCQR